MDLQNINTIESALVGKWINEEVGLFFDGKKSNGDLATLKIGNEKSGLSDEFNYQVFLKENNPVIRIIIEPTDLEDDSTEWIIEEIDASKGILRVINQFNRETSFFK